MITKIKNTISMFLVDKKILEKQKSINNSSRFTSHSYLPAQPIGFKPRSSSSYYLTNQHN